MIELFARIRSETEREIKSELNAQKGNKKDIISKALNDVIFEIKDDQSINEFFQFLLNGVDTNIFSLKDYEFFINRINEKLDFLKKNINLNFKWNILKKNK